MVTLQASTQAGSKHENGLTQYEAKERLEQEGYNELPQGKKQSPLEIILSIVKEPMFLLLIISSGIYFLLGDAQEAMMLLVMVLLVIALTFYQEHKTERALQALRDLSSPKALVLRDGEMIRIPGREVVRDDIVFLSEGDRIPADGQLIGDTGISVDESLLTGESVPVRKDSHHEANVFSGTLVVQGQTRMKVSQIGHLTQMGAIGHSLDTLTSDSTLLQKETRHWVKLFGLWGLFLSLLAVIAFGIMRHQWIQGLLAGITLAMSVLPEEFPMVLTVFLALGAWRISKHNVLTRRAHAIEALGTTSVLCVDKTGTLTQNKMSVVEIQSQKSDQEILEIAALASQPDAIDPMDKAVFEALHHSTNQSNQLSQTSRQLKKLYPVTRECLAMIGVWQNENESYTLTAKGAPETIFQLCHLDIETSNQYQSQLNTMSQNGLRVLAVAKCETNDPSAINEPRQLVFEFTGFLGFMDPLRPEVTAAIKDCHNAGIRVMMLTGDYPETAKSIGREIGLSNPNNVITGEQLRQLSDEKLLDTVKNISIFARMIPEEKLRLVNALKGNHQIVAMTGDGVNDAPALKASHIGIAMGKRGTDVARETADLVLLDDAFSSIVKAIQLGRQIFDNLQKAFTFVFAIHIPIAGMTIIPILLNWPLMLLPAHIAFLEMIIDPACSIAFESQSADKDIMKRPPRLIDAKLVTNSLLLKAAIEGTVIFLGVLAVYYIAQTHYSNDTAPRTMGFVTLLIGNLILITSNLAGQQSILKSHFWRNKAYWTVVTIALGLIVVILEVPLLRKLFGFYPINLADYGLCALASIIAFLILIAIQTGTSIMLKTKAKAA